MLPASKAAIVLGLLSMLTFLLGTNAAPLSALDKRQYSTVDYGQNKAALDAFAAQLSYDIYTDKTTQTWNLKQSYWVNDLYDTSGHCTSLQFDYQYGAQQDAAVYAAVAGGWQIVVYRGSETFSDFARDLQFIAQSCNMYYSDCGVVHQGFWEEMGERLGLRNYVRSDLKTLVTGHSLGAAIATLEALLYKRWVPAREMRVVTFGSPRVGNADFARAFYASGIDSATRYVNFKTDSWFGDRDQDVVTAVPPEFLGLVHVGDLVELETSSYARKCWYIQGCYTLEMHSSALYLAGLQRRVPISYCSQSYRSETVNGTEAHHPIAQSCSVPGPNYPHIPVNETVYSTCTAPDNSTAPTQLTSKIISNWTCLEHAVNKGSFTPIALSNGGNPVCMSSNAWDCLWASAECCSSLASSAGARPTFLECGAAHASAWNSTGYDHADHWCRRSWDVLRPNAILPTGC